MKYTINLMECKFAWMNMLIELDKNNIIFKHEVEFKKSNYGVKFKRNDLIFENKEDMITTKLKYL